MLVNIVFTWDIEECSLAVFFDIPTQDIIHRYQCNNPIVSPFLSPWT